MRVTRPREFAQLCHVCRRQLGHRQQANRPRVATAGSVVQTSTATAPRPMTDIMAAGTRTTSCWSQRRYSSHTTSPQQLSTGNAQTASGASDQPAATTQQQQQQQQQQPPTHYSLFPQTFPEGPPPASPFAVDTARLRREFLQLQARAHPDRHAGRADKRRAEAASARINEAYRTLAAPLARAQYLLSLRSAAAETEDEAGRVEDGELLAEVLEAREDIEGAVAEADLEGVARANEARVRDCEEALARAFAADDLAAAARETVRLRYWVNIRESLLHWEPGREVVLQH